MTVTTKTFFIAKTFHAHSTNSLRREKSLRNHGGYGRSRDNSKKRIAGLSTARVVGYRGRGTHAEVEVTAELVQELLRDQHPDLPVTPGARGWDNQLWRRGRPGGKPTWGPPAHAALRRLGATARS